jgi:hypothetical protein
MPQKLPPAPPVIDDTDAPFFAPAPPTADTEWGKAALATGGILLVAGFPGILLVIVLSMNWNRLIASSDTDLTAAIGYFAYTFGVLTAMFAAGSAIRAWMAASRRGRTVAWALHGLVIGLLAFSVWGIALYSWIKCIHDVERQQFPINKSMPQAPLRVAQ